MVTRADKYTTRSSSSVYFSDFYNSFRKNPRSGFFDRVTNEDSVKQAVRNLILTDRGERLYQPYVGGDVNAHLFEPLDNFSADDLKSSITLTIRNNEHRVDELDVQVYPDEMNNTYRVNIFFTIINNKTPNSLEITLTRTR